MIAPASGTLLIAEPFLKDPAFMRSVVLLCRHSEEEGSFGFALHKKFEGTLDQIISGMTGYKLTVYSGGPVGTDTLHYLHNYPEYFPDCQKVADDIYWGGDFELMKTLIKANTIDPAGIRFFLGYSGWSEGQLNDEMEAKSWLTTTATADLIFDTASDEIWNASLIRLGGKYSMLIHYPTDPQLN